MNRPESHESGVAVCRIADIAGQWTRAQAPPKLDLPCSHPSSTAGTPAAQASALGPLLTRGSTRWFDATNETPRGDSPPAASHQVSSPPGPCQSRPAEHPALRALRKGKLAFAFSGGGWLFPYHLGCVTVLHDMGVITDRTPLAGASAGATLVACLNSGCDPKKLPYAFMEFSLDCSTGGTVGRVREVSIKLLHKLLPPDAYLRCRDTAYISLTKVFPYLHTYIITDYKSQEDLIHAVAASSHVPGYVDGSFMTRFRNHWFVDGGLLRNIPHLPAAASAEYVVGISCTPLKYMSSLPGVAPSVAEVSPDMFEPFPWKWHEVAGLMLNAAPDELILQLVEMGKRDIMTWAGNAGITSYVHSQIPLQKHAAALSFSPKPTTPSPSAHLQAMHADDDTPGGLPQCLEDDWHDAVENQSPAAPAAQALYRALSARGGKSLRGDCLAEAVVHDGLLGAAEAVASQLAMDADEALDALAGTSTLGLAQAALSAARGGDASSLQAEILLNSAPTTPLLKMLTLKSRRFRSLTLEHSASVPSTPMVPHTPTAVPSTHTHT